MGQGASQFMGPLFAWIQQQQAKRPVPEPTADEVLANYLAVVKYAYSHPKDATIFLDDVQKRFYTRQCAFRWTWSEERPTTPLTAKLITTAESPNAGSATESYRKVVEAISKKPENYKDILEDIKIRYFDPAVNCSARALTSAADYRKDLGPVFR